jgi:hypothetical protein
MMHPNWRYWQHVYSLITPKLQRFAVSSYGSRRTPAPDKTSTGMKWQPYGKDYGHASKPSSMPMKHLITHPSPDTFANDIARLQHALTTVKVSDPEYIKLKTLLEQAAGRFAIEKERRDSSTYKGLIELQRRFGRDAVLGAHWDHRDNMFFADVIVQPADGSAVMTFTEDLEHFPSDECIANIALVV